MTTWETDLQDVRRRLADLDPERELASARAAAASARWARGEFFLPLPLIARERLSVQGAWEDAPEHEDWTAERVELDAEDRPVVHVLGAGSFMERVNEMWWWDADGSLLEIALMGWGPHVRRWRDGHVVCASEHGRVKVQRLSEARADAAEVDDDGVLWAVATAWVGDRLLRARERVARGHASTDGRAAPGREASAAGPVRSGRVTPADGSATTADLAAALDRAARLVPDETVWDGRLERPEPWPEDGEALRG